jgi:hypothetical protein
MYERNLITTKSFVGNPQGKRPLGKCGCNIKMNLKEIQGAKKGLKALGGYSTHFNEQKIPTQHMSRNQCPLRYGRVLHLTGY